MRQQRSPYDDPLSYFIWWYPLMQILMLFASNSVIVFLRNWLGFRLMKPWVFGVTFCALMLLSLTSTVASGSVGGTGTVVTPLALFAVAMILLARFHRRRAWPRVFDTVHPLHGMSRGDSHLSRLLPAALEIAETHPLLTWTLPYLTEFHIQRYVEPTLCMGLGLFFALNSFTSLLGLWLIFSGVCLAGMEALKEALSIEQLCATRDQEIEARWMKEQDELLKRMNDSPNSMSDLPVGKRYGLSVSPSQVILRLRQLRQQATTDSQETPAQQSGGVPPGHTDAADYASINARYRSPMEPVVRVSNGRAPKEPVE